VRRILALSAIAVLIAALANLVLIRMEGTARARMEGLARTAVELGDVAAEHRALAALIGEAEGRRSLGRARGVVEAVDAVLAPIGIKERLKSVKQLTADAPGEDKAEVVLQGLSLNETVNLLFEVDRAPMLLIVRKADLKTSFENPSLMNLSITLSYMRPQ
jgi:hypothetical protein